MANIKIGMFMVFWAMLKVLMNILVAQDVDEYIGWHMTSGGRCANDQGHNQGYDQDKEDDQLCDKDEQVNDYIWIDL